MAQDGRRVRLATTSFGHLWRSSGLDENLEMAYCLVDRAGQAGCDAVCLPEYLTVRGWNPTDDQVCASFQTVPGPIADRYAALARKHRMYVVGWLFERDGDRAYNSAVLFDRSGAVVGTYRKVHLTATEATVWGLSPGTGFPVFETDFGRVGVMICYDDYFPETSRVIALSGADVIFYPRVGWPYEVVGEIKTRARAIDNTVFVVAAVLTGRAMVVDRHGYVIADSGHQPGVFTADVDLDQHLILKGSGGTRGPVRYERTWQKVRRPDLYGKIVEGDLPTSPWSEVLVDERGEPVDEAVRRARVGGWADQ